MTLFWMLLLFAVVVAVWYGFESSWDRRLFASAPGQVCANLNAKQAQVWLREHPETQVLDVRSANEFAGGALPRALNISIGNPDFAQKVNALDKSKPVLVYCAGGYRSRKAVAILKESGFQNIQHIHRGYLSWKPDTQP